MNGIQTSATFAGGFSTALEAEAYEYDGTDWTVAASLSDSREALASFGKTGTTVGVFGGDAPSTVGKTEQFDGSSWTEVADLATARGSLGGTGTNTLGIAVGKLPVGTQTEEWTVAQNIKVLTD